MYMNPYETTVSKHGRFVIFMLTVIFSNQKPKDGRVIQSLVRLQLMADPKGRAWLDTTVSTEQVLHSIKF